MNDDPLRLDPETMRRLGYRAVDMLVAHEGTAAAGNRSCVSGTPRASSTSSGWRR